MTTCIGHFARFIISQKTEPVFSCAPWLICGTLGALPLAAQAGDGAVDALGGFSGGSYASPASISADGSVVVGVANDASGANHAFRWTRSGGAGTFSGLGGDTSVRSAAMGVSADGAVVVGHLQDLSDLFDGRGNVAFRWTESGGMVRLGTLSGGSYSMASAVSANGAVVVGVSNQLFAVSSGSGNIFISGGTGNSDLLLGDDLGDDLGDLPTFHLQDRAFRWTESGGMRSLGVLNGGTSSYAHGVSADGSVVVGKAADGAAGNAYRAFRWTEASDNMVSLGTLNGGNYSAATGVSADGEVVVGVATDGHAGNADRAFRWTAATQMLSLGTLNGGTGSVASGISADGRVVVGGAADGAAGNAYRAFRWTEGGGMKSVESWLRAAGVTVAPGFATRIATATNRDGSVVVGQLDDGDPDCVGDSTDCGTAFIARVSPLGSGLVTLADVRDSIAGTAASGGMALAAAVTVLNGAQRCPQPAAGASRGGG